MPLFDTRSSLASHAGSLASFASSFTQHTHLLTLRFSAGAELSAQTLLPHRLSCDEHLSRCYRYKTHSAKGR